MDKFLTDDLKKKVSAVVDAYKYNYASEYESFKAQQKAKVALNEDKFATTGSEYLERELYVIPETLDILLRKILSLEEHMAFRDNLPEFKNSKEGKPMSRWFAKTFPEFRASELV